MNLIIILYFVLVYRAIHGNVLKNKGINLQTLEDKDMTLLLENNIRGGISSLMNDRYVQPDENKKII